MWVRIGILLVQMLARLALRLAPFLAIFAAGLARRHRWRAYYWAQRFRFLKPRLISTAAVGLLLLVLLAFGVGLYLLVTWLAPR